MSNIYVVFIKHIPGIMWMEKINKHFTFILGKRGRQNRLFIP